MYTEVKIGIAFIFGVGVGILGSREFFKTKYQKIADEEIESVKSALEYRSGHILEKDSISNPEEFAEKINDEMTKQEPRLYSSLDIARRQELIVKSEHPEEDRSSDIFEITEEDYSETEIQYDKRTLHYYTDDDMLVNADDGDWTNQDIPNNCLETIRSSTQNELYFRDDAKAIDYEVVRIEGAYYIDM